MNNQKQFNEFTYNTKCNIWRVSFDNTIEEYLLKDYYSDNYNIVIYDNNKIYKGICINQLHMFYGELCTMYYVWKNNLKSDIVGFDQYGKQWQDINYNEINNGKIQTYIHFNEDLSIINHFNTLGHFIYNFISYIKFNYPEYNEHINDILFNYEYSVKDHINIFICKWEIFDKICQIVFGYLDNIMPHNGWQNENIINEYIDFNICYHKKLGFDESTIIGLKSSRYISFLFEQLNGTLYNIISKSFNDGKKEYYVVYNCNTMDDYHNILKLYKYNIGNGIRYILIKDNNNIFKHNFNDDCYIYKYLFLYNYPYIINDSCYDMFDIAKNDYLGEVKKYGYEIELKTNEYVYTDNSIELNKGNYIIKTI